MAIVTYEHPIDHLSGKIAKQFRVIYLYRKESKRKFTSVRGVRTTPVTENEQATRVKFATVARAVAERAQDLTKKAQDIAAFKAQKDSPGGKKTMKSYLWSLELAAYQG